MTALLVTRAVGVKSTSKVVLFPAATVRVGDVAIEKRAAPVPERVGVVKVSAVVPVLLMVKVLVMVLPISVPPKLV